MRELSIKAVLVRLWLHRSVLPTPGAWRRGQQNYLAVHNFVLFVCLLLLCLNSFLLSALHALLRFACHSHFQNEEQNLTMKRSVWTGGDFKSSLLIILRGSLSLCFLAVSVGMPFRSPTSHSSSSCAHKFLPPSITRLFSLVAATVLTLRFFS